MIKINYCYLDKFKRSSYGYLFPVSKGVYLSFDRNSLEYSGIQTFYNSAYYPVSKGDKVLERLMCLGYIELYTE